MSLTREQAICNHRNMWSWIADEMEKQQMCVNESNELKHFNISEECLVARCWLRTYRGTVCGPGGWECVLEWPGGRCSYVISGSGYSYVREGLYTDWRDAIEDEDVQLAADLARKIANLPEA